jgi:hypothetical protein
MLRTGLAGVLAAGLILWPAVCRAVDSWTEPYVGIRHLHRTTPGLASVHVLLIDLTQGTGLRATSRRARWQRTSDYARAAGAAVAVNGGPWAALSQTVEGLAAGAGRVWSAPDGAAAFVRTREGRALIVRGDELGPLLAEVTDGVTGQPLLVLDGARSAALAALAPSRDARTAVGVSRDGRTVILTVADGRGDGSQGATLVELADLLLEHGAERALNLDGGSSTTLWVGAEGGVVNRPSRGWEREVVNHLAVFAREPASRPPAEVRPTPPRAGAPGAAAVVPPSQALRSYLRRAWLLDELFLGRRREWVVPSAFVALVVGAPTGLLVLLRRGQRRAHAPAALTAPQPPPPPTEASPPADDERPRPTRYR